MTSAQIIIVVTIVLYLVAMVFVGVYFGKKGSGSSSDDFYLGGRKMGPVVTAMSAEASDMSSYLLMGLPGLAYLCGLPEVTWTAIGLAIGTYLNWLIVARACAGIRPNSAPSRSPTFSPAASEIRSICFPASRRS